MLVHPSLVAAAAEWVPVGRLKDAGLINACGFMLNTTEFRDAACDVMRQVAGAYGTSARTGSLRLGTPLVQPAKPRTQRFSRRRRRPALLLASLVRSVQGASRETRRPRCSEPCRSRLLKR